MYPKESKTQNRFWVDQGSVNKVVKFEKNIFWQYQLPGTRTVRDLARLVRDLARAEENLVLFFVLQRFKH